ncbi:MAG: hypothetical protein HY084_04040 [Gemmatimonadetes bacterium]|nr:hypothetical protein [Gemmatimonadota bacterium]
MTDARRVTIVALLLLAPVRMRAQETCVEVVRHEPASAGRTLDEVKQDALHGAIAEAVRRVAGVRVQGSETVTAGDSAGRATSRYAESVRLDAEGRATGWTVVRERWTPAKTGAPGAAVTYDLTLRVCVARETGTRDPGFVVSLVPNATRLLVRGATPAANDELVARVTASRDASITLVLMSGDSVFVLTPNALMPSPVARAGEAAELPEASLRESGLRFRAALPDGVDHREEWLTVIATRRPVALVAPAGQGGARDTGVLSLAEFDRWLVGIPLDVRATAQVAVRVERAR